MVINVKVCYVMFMATLRQNYIGVDAAAFHSSLQGVFLHEVPQKEISRVLSGAGAIGWTFWCRVLSRHGHFVFTPIEWAFRCLVVS